MSDADPWFTDADVQAVAELMDDENDRILAVIAERDGLRQVVARVAALAEEWFESSASGHPLCDPSEDCAGCVADQLRAILDPTDNGSAS